MEHTTTVLPSMVPLLHRRQKYMGPRLKIVTIMDLGSTLDFWLKGVWSTLLTWRVLALVFVGMSGAKNCAVTDSGLVSNIDQIA